MRELIGRIREEIPFDMPESDICSGSCKGCSKKLLEYLESEVDNWDYKLSHGETPDFGDISSLARSGKKIFKVLKVNGLI
ncbi:hypothetical protein [Endozoicomonas sp. Mp262]|uniref:hypothetical protein n=1 Tax=Endozoicomonas sp. Mp262 TaxID=2919499 RepID=UPI0021DB288A